MKKPQSNLIDKFEIPQSKEIEEWRKISNIELEIPI